MTPRDCHGVFVAGALFTGLLLGACVPFETDPVAGTVMEAPVTAAPGPSETYLSLGKRLLAAREPDLAIKAFLGSMNNEGVSAQAMTGAAIAYHQQGLLTEARRYFEQASRLKPDSVIVHNNLGVVLHQLKEYYLARDEFRTAFALSNGTSELAEQNLNRAEETIAAIELVPETDQAISYRVERLGGGEFRLVELVSPDIDPIAE